MTATLHLDNTYTLTLDGETVHNILSTLTDAERTYRTAGFIGMADNALKAHDAIITQLAEEA